MNKKLKIVVFSPHLDDAALDAGDHIRAWTSKGHEVTVVTIFSSFIGKKISKDARRYTGIEFRSPQEFEEVRKKEDKKAMALLGVDWKHLDFVDGGFRIHNDALVYPSFRELFSGTISSFDRMTQQKLEKKMMPYLEFSRAYVPLGVGRHADHILVRRAAEAVFPKSSLGYYIDYPYALSPLNWSPVQIFTVLRLKKSFIWFKKTKESLLSCYSSQISRLFSSRPTHPEVILG